MRGWLGAVAMLALVGCSSDSSGGDAGGAGGAPGGSGGSAAGSSAGGASGAQTGGTAGVAGSVAGAGGSSGGAGGAGGNTGEVLFSDDFDSERAEWQFDAGDPDASYVYENGELVVTGGSAQAFVWLPVDPAWGSDYQVDVRFRIESGMVGGAVVRAQDTDLVNAHNCNLREDLDQLRAARHSNRSYLTIGSAETPVDLHTSYAISARVTGDTLICSQDGGPSFATPWIPTDTKAVGLFVYRGTVHFESFTLRR